MPEVFEPDEISVGEALLAADTFVLKFIKTGRTTSVFMLDRKAIAFLRDAIDELCDAYNIPSTSKETKKDKEF